MVRTIFRRIGNLLQRPSIWPIDQFRPLLVGGLFVWVFDPSAGKQSGHQSHAGTAQARLQPGHDGHIYTSSHGTKTQSAERSDSFDPRPHYGACNWGVMRAKLVPVSRSAFGPSIRKLAPLAGFALSLLLVRPLLFPQTSVNIRPKLLQLIPEGVDAHLHAPAGETR
jgi:hypothetical protein